ncbi:substrate-binding domain-containing protein, partial [Streptomyces hirsutus]
PCGTGRGAARAIAERLLREQPALTGVVVHNEPLLDPLIDAFEELGVRIPEDLSLTAVCSTPVAASARIPLTSVTVPSTELGTRAVHLLVRKLSGAPVPQATLLPPRLTERASTGPRPA